MLQSRICSPSQKNQLSQDLLDSDYDDSAIDQNGDNFSVNRHPLATAYDAIRKYGSNGIIFTSRLTALTGYKPDVVQTPTNLQTLFEPPYSITTGFHYNFCCQDGMNRTDKHMLNGVLAALMAWKIMLQYPDKPFIRAVELANFLNNEAGASCVADLREGHAGFLFVLSKFACFDITRIPKSDYVQLSKDPAQQYAMELVYLKLEPLLKVKRKIPVPNPTLYFSKVYGEFKDLEKYFNGAEIRIIQAPKHEDRHYAIFPNTSSAGAVLQQLIKDDKCLAQFAYKDLSSNANSKRTRKNRY